MSRASFDMSQNQKQIPYQLQTLILYHCVRIIAMDFFWEAVPSVLRDLTRHRAASGLLKWSDCLDSCQLVTLAEIRGDVW